MNIRLQKKEKNKAFFKKYYEKHSEEIKKRTAQWYKDNPDKAKQHRLNRYGITVAELNHMTITQNGKCSICGVLFDSEKVRKVIDHDHKTEEVRELLCAHCNTGIGYFKENINTLKSAVSYLEKWKGY